MAYGLKACSCHPLNDKNPASFPSIVFLSSSQTKKLSISSIKGHNPWLTKSRVFDESTAEHGRIYIFLPPQKKEIITKN